MIFWKVPEMWKGGDCWIIGGGSSFPRQFDIPDKLIKEVETKQSPISVYSPYLRPLYHCNVIGINIAFMLGNWISMMYFCDAGFFRVHHKEIVGFPNIKATCVGHLDRNLLPQARNIKRLKRDNRYGLSFKRDTICWNHNSGAAAINVAVLAGAKRILLLGFDMKPDDQGRTHWHEGFQAYTKKTSPMSFKRFLKPFPQIAKDAKKHGVEILNVSRNSAIEDFRKVDLKEVL